MGFLCAVCKENGDTRYQFGWRYNEVKICSKKCNLDCFVLLVKILSIFGLTGYLLFKTLVRILGQNDLQL